MSRLTLSSIIVVLALFRSFFQSFLALAALVMLVEASAAIKPLFDSIVDPENDEEAIVRIVEGDV